MLVPSVAEGGELDRDGAVLGSILLFGCGVVPVPLRYIASDRDAHPRIELVWLQAKGDVDLFQHGRRRGDRAIYYQQAFFA